MQSFPKGAIPAQVWQGKLAGRDLPWDKVADAFTIEKATAHVIWLGNRCALSTGKGAKSETRSSAYAKVFKQGATIVPRNFYFVTVDGLNGKREPDRLYYAKTSEHSAKDSKPPYQDVRLQGNVEGRFLFGTAISRHVLPFALLELSPIVLPLEESQSEYFTLDTNALRRKGYREFAKWMEQAEAIWKEKRGAKSARQSALQRIDYQRGLTSQTPAHRHLVLYNAAGTNVSATYCDRQAQDLPLLVEHKLYWAAFNNAAEAHFVTAVLNSASVNDAIKPFQSTGLLGERDIEKKLLDVPLPLFNSENALHVKLSECGSEAHRRAVSVVHDQDFPSGSSLARQRAYVRTALTDVMAEIDGLVRILLGLGK